MRNLARSHRFFREDYCSFHSSPEHGRIFFVVEVPIDCWYKFLIKSFSILKRSKKPSRMANAARVAFPTRKPSRKRRTHWPMTYEGEGDPKRSGIYVNETPAMCWVSFNAILGPWNCHGLVMRLSLASNIVTKLIHAMSSQPQPFPKPCPEQADILSWFPNTLGGGSLTFWIQSNS